jgi:hypothetical protein
MSSGPQSRPVSPLVLQPSLYNIIEAEGAHPFRSPAATASTVTVSATQAMFTLHPLYIEVVVIRIASQNM